MNLLSSIISLLLLLVTIPTVENNKYPETVDFFEVDVLGNIYFVNKNELKKYNSEAQLLKTYSNFVFGEISSIDVTDAMNILIYYQLSNNVVMLDNQLSVKNSPINLVDLGYPEASMACMSYNNGFWIYDPVGKELLRFSQLLTNTNHSGNLSVITQYEIEPVQIIERNNTLLLRDNKNGIFVFDKYGGYLRRMPFTALDDFYIKSGVWQMLKNDTNFIYNPLTQNIDTIPMPYKNIKEFRLDDKAIYMLNKKGEFTFEKL